MYITFQPQITQVAKDLFQSQISDLVTMIVSGVLDGLNEQLKNLSQRNNELKKQNTDMKKENSELQKRVKTLESAADAAEQYSRRNCLRISGLEETDRENTDNILFDIAEAIDVNIDLRDIDRSHRLGKPGTEGVPRTKPRDIIVKVVSYRVRSMFYKARTQSKDKHHENMPI